MHYYVPMRIISFLTVFIFLSIGMLDSFHNSHSHFPDTSLHSQGIDSNFSFIELSQELEEGEDEEELSYKYQSFKLVKIRNFTIVANNNIYLNLPNSIWKPPHIS